MKECKFKPIETGMNKARGYFSGPVNKLFESDCQHLLKVIILGI
jgi:hypothetical protein